jgi:ferredoxin
VPWIKTEDCVTCGVCVGECPVGAISMDDTAALIDEKACIRYGKCHDVCPEEAVRHDSERIPQDVEANIEWTRELLHHFDTPAERRGLVERMKRYFAKECKVAEQSILRLEQMSKEL